MLTQNSLSKIIRWYKGRSTFEINHIMDGFRWQSRFHDVIIRDSEQRDRIRQYITTNAQQWPNDCFYPSTLNL